MRKKVLVLLATVALLGLLIPACIVQVTPTPVPVAANWVNKLEVADLIPQVLQPQPGGGDLRLRWRSYSATGDFVGTSVYALTGVRPATALATPAAGIVPADGLWTFRGTYKPGTSEQRSGQFVCYFRFTYDAARPATETFKGEWRILGGTGDFGNLSGQGTSISPATDTYTFTGQISFGPK